MRSTVLYWRLNCRFDSLASLHGLRTHDECILKVLPQYPKFLAVAGCQFWSKTFVSLWLGLYWASVVRASAHRVHLETMTILVMESLL
jgi:hypothetical protein